jgi:hypothetical protein
MPADLVVRGSVARPISEKTWTKTVYHAILGLSGHPPGPS